MKKLLYIVTLTLLVVSCNEKRKKAAEKALPDLNVLEKNKPISTTCYLATGKAITTQNHTLQDSTLLTIQTFEQQKIKGKFSWLPAEKDSKKGEFEGAKNGNTIKGIFTYMQEGITATAPIQIDIENTNALVTLYKDTDQELQFSVDKTNCN